MTQPSEQPVGAPQTQQHPGGAAYPRSAHATPPRRRRPRALWFAVGGALLVLAPIAFGGALILTLRPLTQEDAVFVADGSPQPVRLPAGEERGLFTDDASTSCVVADGSGRVVDLRTPGGDFTFNEWTAIGRFDTGAGQLTFTCSGASATSQVRVGQLPSTSGLVGGIAAGILLPMLLGLTGLVVLIVTGVLWATGVPRSPRGDP